MEEATNTILTYMHLCNENFKTLLLYTEVRWLSKGLRLERLVNLWETLINFLMYKSQMTHYNSKKQTDGKTSLAEIKNIQPELYF